MGDPAPLMNLQEKSTTSRSVLKFTNIGYYCKKKKYAYKCQIFAQYLHLNVENTNYDLSERGGKRSRDYLPVRVQTSWVLLYVELSSLGVKRQMRVQSWDETTIFHHGQYKTRAG